MMGSRGRLYGSFQLQFAVRSNRNVVAYLACFLPPKFILKAVMRLPMSSLGSTNKQAWSGQPLLCKHERNNELNELPTQNMQPKGAISRPMYLGAKRVRTGLSLSLCAWHAGTVGCAWMGRDGWSMKRGGIQMTTHSLIMRARPWSLTLRAYRWVPQGPESVS